MNHKFVKHIFLENGSNLPTTLALNFEITRASKNHGFQKFELQVFTAGLENQVIQIFKKKKKKKSESIRQLTFRDVINFP